MSNELGIKIKKLREIKGYSQQYMAKKLSICQEQYSYIENKQKHIPDELAEHISELLGVSSQFLVSFDIDKILQDSTKEPYVALIEKLILQTHENEIIAYRELIERLKEEILELKKENK